MNLQSKGKKEGDGVGVTKGKKKVVMKIGGKGKESNN
jgi:hypothetical protein